MTATRVTTEGYIEIPVTDTMREKVRSYKDEVAKTHHTFRGENSRYYGGLGEEAVALVYPFLTRVNTIDHDFEYHGATVEVKTKRRTVRPTDNFEASIAKYTIDWQHPSFYIFVSLLEECGDITTAYVLGYLKSDDLYGCKVPHREFSVGDIDPSNGWKVSKNCINIFHRDLRRVRIKES